MMAELGHCRRIVPNVDLPKFERRAYTRANHGCGMEPLMALPARAAAMTMTVEEFLTVIPGFTCPVLDIFEGIARDTPG